MLFMSVIKRIVKSGIVISSGLALMSSYVFAASVSVPKPKYKNEALPIEVRVG